MDFDVLVVGELNVDLVISGGDVTPEFGQKDKLVRDATLTVGASAAIFACQAARLGLKVAIVGVVGQDLFGQMVLSSLSARGVYTGMCMVAPGLKTGVSVILSRSDGDRAILTYSGSIGALRADQIDPALFSKARHLHLAAYYLLDSLRPDLPDVLREARRAGMTVSLDTNWDPGETWQVGDMLSLCDIFLPNEKELLAITHMAEVESALDYLARQVGIVAVKQGERGATAHRGQEVVRCPALPVKVRDTVGAGDSFNAGFVYGYLANWPLARSLQLACACGSLSTRGAGGTDNQPSLDEALQAIALSSQ